jgi:alpha-glucosidase
LNRPEVHEIFRRWRALCDSYDPHRILIGETFVMDIEAMAAYYGDGDDELNLAFNFPFVLSTFEPALLRDIIATSDKLIPPNGWPAWFLSNHDVGRFTSRWCGRSDAKIRCCLMMLMSLRGTPFLYYGDEIAMTHVALTRKALKDPVGLRFWPKEHGRDPCRTPMQWSAEPGAGFTAAGATPWLPIGPHRDNNVELQRADRGSVINLCRDLIGLRRAHADLRRAPYEPLDALEGAWAWRRGAFAVALNMSDGPVAVEGIEGRVCISTGRDRDDDRVAGRVELRPWEGIIARST